MHEENLETRDDSIIQAYAFRIIGLFVPLMRSFSVFLCFIASPKRLLNVQSSHRLIETPQR